MATGTKLEQLAPYMNEKEFRYSRSSNRDEKERTIGSVIAKVARLIYQPDKKERKLDDFFPFARKIFESGSVLTS